MSVPRIIHQVFFDPAQPGRRMPPILSDNVDELRRRNPLYEHRLYDMERMSNFVRRWAPSYLEVFESIQPEYAVCKVDLFRYLLMWIVGGVYLDIKSSMNRPLLDVTDQSTLVQWDNEEGEAHEGWGLHPEVRRFQGGEFLNGFLAFKPHHLAMLATAQLVRDNLYDYTADKFGVGLMGVVRTTGTIPLTLACRQYLEGVRVVRRPADIGYVVTVFDTKFGHKSVWQQPLITTPGAHYSTQAGPICTPKS